MSWASLASNELVTFTELQNAVDTDVFLRRTSFSSTLECVTKSDASTYLFIDTSYGPYAGLASNEEITKADLTQATCIQFQISGVYLSTSGLNVEVIISSALPASGTLTFDWCGDNGAEGTITFNFSSGNTGAYYTGEFNTNSTGTYVTTAGTGTINQMYVKGSTVTYSTGDTTRCYQAVGAEFSETCGSPGSAEICLNCA